MKLIEYLKTDTFLRQFIMATLGFLVLLNTFAVWALGDKLRIEPVEVLDAINERLEVTPKEVMEELTKISAKQDENFSRLVIASSGELSTHLDIMIAKQDTDIAEILDAMQSNKLIIVQNRDAMLHIVQALKDAAL